MCIWTFEPPLSYLRAWENTFNQRTTGGMGPSTGRKVWKLENTKSYYLNARLLAWQQLFPHPNANATVLVLIEDVRCSTQDLTTIDEGKRGSQGNSEAREQDEASEQDEPMSEQDEAMGEQAEVSERDGCHEMEDVVFVHGHM